jgi:hypothetical protein
MSRAIDYSKYIRLAAKELQDNGEPNRAGILRDAAADYEVLCANVDALRAEVDALLQNDRQATDEFNAGYEAFTAGLDVDAAEIEYRSVLPSEIPSYDSFTTGYAWAKFQAERKAG